MAKISIGDRVRAKVPTLGGWQGTGTVVAVDDNIDVVAIRASSPPWRDRMLFCIEEVEPEVAAITRLLFQ
jgi:hypothetical protein